MARKPSVPEDSIPPHRNHVFLSLNRFERKKNHALAIRALGTHFTVVPSFTLKNSFLGVLQSQLSEQFWDEVHLVIAGGYDLNLPENVAHFFELQRLVENLGLTSHVTLLRSPSEEAKVALLMVSTALLYTPENEHFGIVPLEAMFCETPVIACNSGGPLETVENEKSGFLVPSESNCFAESMQFFLQKPSKKVEFGSSGHKRVIEKFSSNVFSEQLCLICKELL
ncbi:unnamed protein product [Soboliphyme baturini]|uniref:Alpha-1,3/1,6-mannosyltransferase ALG2 n=1 Tax=Soboliphyme baturini TaxID=241478 RepID=A0A183J4F0_9BILA|nr:unnamed protein product [Soboliphyme baturini]